MKIYKIKAILYPQLWIIGLVIGCSTGPSSAGPSFSRPSILVACSAEIDEAVMSKVRVGDWNSVNVYRATKEDLDHERAEIARIFAWSKTIQDKEIRSCYERWLGYYDYELDGAYKELDKRVKRRDWVSHHEVPVPPDGSMP